MYFSSEKFSKNWKSEKFSKNWKSVRNVSCEPTQQEMVVEIMYIMDNLENPT